MSANAILKLQAAGFTVEQVTALADLIDIQAASKVDLGKTEHRLDTRLSEVEHRLDNRITEVEHRLDNRITEVKADIAAARSEAKIDAANMEMRLVRWLVGTGVAAVLAIGGLFAAVIRYLPAAH